MADLPDQTPPKDCIACGRCLDVCPLFKATQHEELSPKATHQLRQTLAVGTPALDARTAERLAALCLGCGRCTAACPQGLSATEVVAAIRAGHPDWRGWVWQRWISNAGLLWPALATLAKTAPDSLPTLRGLAAPRLEPWLQGAIWDARGRGREVVIFPGCTARHLHPHWTASARRLLEQCGYRVLRDPGFACCGATLGHAGLAEAQQAMQRRNIKAWRRAGRPVMVTFCASCRAGLQAYGDGREALVRGWDAVEAARFREAVQPLSPLLRETTFQTIEDRAPAQVVWHEPCHAREGNPDGPFLQRALGGRLVRQVADRCCGLGGVMQLGGSGLPQRVAAWCWEGLVPAGSVPGLQILTGCSGCVVQLAATAPKDIQVGHWLDILKT